LAKAKRPSFTAKSWDALSLYGDEPDKNARRFPLSLFAKQ
jgi:hypothetical protein